MEFSGQSLVKAGGISPAYGDQSGSQLIRQPLNGSDATSFLSFASFTPDGNSAEAVANPRPSYRIIPPDETGTHPVTFSVTISVAFPPGMSALCMCVPRICFFNYMYLHFYRHSVVVTRHL